jgi:hypothetical protein
MPGLVPGIHVLRVLQQSKTGMAGTSPAMTENGVASLAYVPAIHVLPDELY